MQDADAAEGEDEKEYVAKLQSKMNKMIGMLNTTVTTCEVALK